MASIALDGLGLVPVRTRGRQTQLEMLRQQLDTLRAGRGSAVFQAVPQHRQFRRARSSMPWW
jgi:hypothetical protein